MPESFVYDRTLRELFQDVPKTLIKLRGGQVFCLSHIKVYFC